MKRIDVHCPSAIEPENYSFVAFGHQRIDVWDDWSIEEVKRNRALIEDHMTRTGGTWSNHEHAGNCHVCGAHCVYTAVFYYKPDNCYIRTGLDCADKLDSAVDGTAFRKNLKKGIDAKAGKNKAKAILEQEGLSDAWHIYEAEWASLPKQTMKNGCTAEYLFFEEETIRSMIHNLVKYGNLSEKQIAFMRSLIERIKNRDKIAAERKAAHDAAADVPEGKMKVVGKVLSTKWEDYGYYGGQMKMLVQADAGYKLWGSVPSSLANVPKGTQISFEATVMKSDKDPKFGFFKRPKNGQQL